MAPFALGVEANGTDAAVLAVHGELDLATAPRVRLAVGELLGAGVRHLDLDLDDCRFLDSTGIGALLWAAHRLRAAGGDLTVTHVGPTVARTLDLAGLGAVVPVHA